MKLYKFLFVSSLVVAIGVIVGVCLSRNLPPQEAVSQKSQGASDEYAKIVFEDDFFNHICEVIILRAGYDCPYPNKFDLELVENDPGKDAAYRKGVIFCEKEANSGSETHQQCLMHYYTSIQKDQKKALFWAHKCAEQGSDRGMMVLFRAYQSGEGVLLDRFEAMKWMFLSQTAGSTEAKELIKRLEERVPGFQEILPEAQIGYKRAEQWIKEHPHVFFNPNNEL